MRCLIFVLRLIDWCQVVLSRVILLSEDALVFTRDEIAKSGLKTGSFRPCYGWKWQIAAQAPFPDRLRSQSFHNAVICTAGSIFDYPRDYLREARPMQYARWIRIVSNGVVEAKKPRNLADSGLQHVIWMYSHHSYPPP